MPSRVIETAPIAPFDSAETAWFWAMATLMARQYGAPLPPGPCRVEDVLKCLDGLYRHRRIELLHVRILRHWGRRGRAPDKARARERCDWHLWTEAIERLRFPLRRAGIVRDYGEECRISLPCRAVPESVTP